MTEATMTPEAPSAKKRPPMTPEQKAKIAAGRAKWLAEKNAKKAAAESAPAPVSTPAALDVTKTKEYLAALDEIAALKKRLGGKTPEEIAALPTQECFFEFYAGKKTDRDEPIGETLSDPEDPRWDELKNYRGQITGQVVVRRLNRAASGEIVSRDDIQCISAKSAHQARDMIRAWKKSPTGQWY